MRISALFDRALKGRKGRKDWPNTRSRKPRTPKLRHGDDAENETQMYILCICVLVALWRRKRRSTEESENTVTHASHARYDEVCEMRNTGPTNAQ